MRRWRAPGPQKSELLINTVDSWQNRPAAASRIPNFYLASDYVRTSTDLATMEGANEAGRRAVNALIERSGLRSPPCRVFTMRESMVFAAGRLVDGIRFHTGRAHRLGPIGRPAEVDASTVVTGEFGARREQDQRALRRSQRSRGRARPRDPAPRIRSWHRSFGPGEGDAWTGVVQRSRLGRDLALRALLTGLAYGPQRALAERTICLPGALELACRHFGATWRAPWMVAAWFKASASAGQGA